MLYINTHRWEQHTAESQNVSINRKSTTAMLREQQWAVWEANPSRK